MKNIFTVLFFILINSFLFAQVPPGGGNRGTGQQLSGRLYGKIIETSSGKAVEYASVQLLQTKLDTVTKERK
jgi:hypothetical protein